MQPAGFLHRRWLMRLLERKRLRRRSLRGKSMRWGRCPEETTGSDFRGPSPLKTVMTCLFCSFMLAFSLSSVWNVNASE